jgi:Arc/MetJ family transcription regulator
MNYFCAEELQTMATNIDIDNRTLAEIMEMKRFKSKKEAVNEALGSYLRQLRQQQALRLKGTNIWEGNLDEMRRD